MLPITDIHVHIQPWSQLKPAVARAMRAGRSHDYEDIQRYIDSADEFLKHMDRAGIERAGLINYVSPDLMGFTTAANDFVARYCRGHKDRLISFGSIHPRFVGDAAAEADRLLGDLGIRALKLHPPHQLFYPNDYDGEWECLATMYKKCVEYGRPMMFHTGTSIFPRARSKYGHPMALDDVAVDFPNLPIIMAHGGRPLWMKEAFFLLRRHKNMWMDVSSIPPSKLLEYFPRLEEISHRVLWGTDWPGPMVKDLRRNVDAFLELPLSEPAQRRILHENSLELFPR